MNKVAPPCEDFSMELCELVLAVSLRDRVALDRFTNEEKLTTSQLQAFSRPILRVFGWR